MPEQRSKPYDLFISYAEADRGWVEGYLLDALEAAGVDVHSEEAFRLGAPRLLEFERAVQGSQRTLLVLTAAYLAEGWNEFFRLMAQSYDLDQEAWRVIPLRLEPVELPPGLATLIPLDATDPAERDRALERLCADLQRPLPAPAPRPECPYPGMEAFSEEDAERFFGRDTEVEELLQNLRLHPFLAVIGPSGSGKSSLVFAGLVPALRRSALFGPGGWLVRTVRPGEAPLAELRTALGGDPADPERAVEGLLATQPGARRLLWVVDQFEELFTQARVVHPEEVEPFQQALLRLCGLPRCYTVITARADFYAELMNCPLWPEIQAHRTEVVRLGAEGLRQAIVRPAKGVGVYVEAGLVERLVGDAAGEPGILPFLQETLVLLWEKLQRRFLPLSAYQALGDGTRTGLQVAMQQRADAALAGLAPEAQSIARRIFMRLIQFGEGRPDTRRQQTEAEVQAGEEPALFEPVLRHLADKRLLTLSGEEGDAGRRVDIAHEALLDGWPELRRWVAERRGAEQDRRRLEAKVDEWLRLDRKGGLLDEAELAEAEAWLSAADTADLGVSDRVRALLEASRQRLAGDEQQRLAALARLLAAQADVARGGMANLLPRAVLLAVESLRRMPTVEGDLALRNSLSLLARPLHLVEHEGGVRAMAVSPNGRLCATAGLEGVLWVWDTNTFRERMRVVLPAVVFQLAFSPDGERLATADSDGQVSIWKVTTEEKLANRPHESWIHDLTFDPTGRRVAFASGDGCAHIWDADTLEDVVRLEYQGPGHDANLPTGVSSVAYDLDGERLATGHLDEVVCVWDARNGERLLELPVHGGVQAVDFSPDRGSLAACTGYGEVHLWQSFEGQEVKHLFHRGSIDALAFSPHSQFLAVGGGNLELMVYTVPDGQLTARYPQEQSIREIAFSPDERWVAAASDDHTVRVWWAEGGGEVGRAVHEDQITGTGFGRDARRLITGSYDGTARAWQLGNPLIVSETVRESAAMGLAYSRDGSWLVAGTAATFELLQPDPEAGSSAPPRRHETLAGTVAISGDGRYVATGSGWVRSQDGAAVVWERATGRELARLPHHGQVNSVAFDPTGGCLATASEDGMTCVWNWANEQEIWRQAHGGPVRAVAFSDDGRFLAAASRQGEIHVWSWPEGAEVASSVYSGEVNAVALSPDGRFLAVACQERQAGVLEVSSGRMRYITHDGAVNDVAFSPEGAYLATACWDRTAHVWEAETGQKLIRIDHGGSVYAVAFSPDGRTLASGGYDNRVCVWWLWPEDLMDQACACLTRNLTQGEWLHNLGDEPYRPTCPDLPEGEAEASMASSAPLPSP